MPTAVGRSVKDKGNVSHVHWTSSSDGVPHTNDHTPSPTFAPQLVNELHLESRFIFFCFSAT